MEDAEVLMVTETQCGSAAHKIVEQLKCRGGAWIVMACDVEGFAMEPAASFHAQRMLRSGSPSLAGTFTQGVEVQDLADALAVAVRAEQAPRGRPRTGAQRQAKYRRKWSAVHRKRVATAS